MGCCPESPPILVADDTPPNNGPEQELRPGETVECFSKRAGNSSGAHDDAVENRLEKIQNESITTSSSASVNVQFTLTPGSISPNVTYEISGDALPGVTFTTSGLLSGTFDSSVHSKKLTISISAKSNGAEIDNRTYSFSPQISTDNNSIKFVLPLPGGTVNSPFGMRMHPIHKVMKLHTGIDLKIAPGVDGDVVAAADGVVTKASMTDPRGYGNAIHIKHESGSGKHLCTTTYNHLAKFYVAVGQRVMAGQKIAREGGARGVIGSGGSTGLHLHFECKLPNGSFTDPLPFIKGTVAIDSTKMANGNPGSPSAVSNNSALTVSDVSAKGGCPEIGTSNYPKDPDPNKPEPAQENLPSSGNPEFEAFEHAWFICMKGEVGPDWNTAPGTDPSDPDILAGACETKLQKKKCGFKEWPQAAGGTTKFGIASSGNPATNIKASDYAACKKLGYQNYWLRGKINPSTLGKYLGIFMFDTNYHHGDGNGRSIYNKANIANIPNTASRDIQMDALEKLYNSRMDFANTLKDTSLIKGVRNRVTATYNYIKTLP